MLWTMNPTADLLQWRPPLPAFDAASMEIKAQTPDGYTIAKRGRGPGGFLVYRGTKTLTPLAEFGLWTEAVACVLVEREAHQSFRSGGHSRVHDDWQGYTSPAGCARPGRPRR